MTKAQKDGGGAPPVALTIAGSDSGGGAGIQADLKTFHAFGVFGTSAVTAITAQNTRGVFAIQKAPAELVAEQISAVVTDLAPAAVKTGMLADAEIVRAVARAIEELDIDNVVVDPVMVASSGDRLLEPSAHVAYIDLLGRATVITPNLREAEILAEMEIRDLREMCDAARRLVRLGSRAVLLKGGHLEGDELLDVFHDGERWHVWSSRRIAGANTHGTGCTLSAAIAAGLALGQRLFPAIDRALAFTRGAIERAPALGEGNGPLDHWACANT